MGVRKSKSTADVPGLLGAEAETHFSVFTEHQRHRLCSRTEDIEGSERRAMFSALHTRAGLRVGVAPLKGGQAGDILKMRCPV